MEAEAKPLPKEDTTPPVTKINFVFTPAIFTLQFLYSSNNFPPLPDPLAYRPPPTVHPRPQRKSGGRRPRPGAARDFRFAPAPWDAAGQTSSENLADKHRFQYGDDPITAFWNRASAYSRQHRYHRCAQTE